MKNKTNIRKLNNYKIKYIFANIFFNLYVLKKSLNQKTKPFIITQLRN